MQIPHELSVERFIKGKSHDLSSVCQTLHRMWRQFLKSGHANEDVEDDPV